jgi:serine/threonine protein kinase
MNAEALIGTVLGTCTLQKLLGQGGMGAVYQAQQSRPRRQVAVKVLLPMTPLTPNQLTAFLERFRRETDAAASLEHPNIVPVYEYGEREGLAYLVMPYISGGTLRDLLEREGQLPFEKVMYFLDQIAAAIDCAHEHGVIHRDIKPANILMSRGERLLLTDFGLVKIVAMQQGNLASLTGPGAPIGTPDYMAPEQVIGEEVDARADIYSLGIILYQMVTGTTPFQGETPMQIAAQHLQLPPPPPQTLRPDLPDGAAQVILRALSKRPEDRQSQAQELADAFRMALVNAGILLDTATSVSMSRATVSVTTPAISVRQELNMARPAAEQVSQRANVSRVDSSRKRWIMTGKLPAAQGGGLLTRTGMIPSAAAGKSIDPAEQETAPHPRGLLSRTGKFPQVGTGVLSPKPPVRETITPASGIEMAPTSPLKRELIPTTEQLASARPENLESKTLSRPVKVVRVPVAGQPGRYVTGMLPVDQAAQNSPYASKTDIPQRSRKPAKTIAIILIIMLLLGALGGFLVENHAHGHLSLPAGFGHVASSGQPNILVSDPLDHQINNWLTSPADTYSFKDGAYHIADHGDQGQAALLQGHTFSSVPNMTYSLTMQEVAGNDNTNDNTFGMIFHFNQKTVNNKTVTMFYSFQVENTDGGSYHFWKYDDSQTSGMGAWTDLWHTKFGSEFHEGQGPQATNTLSVAMQGGNFTFIVNGKKVGTAKDTSIPNGMVGMVVNLDGTEVAFKNLLITSQ